MEWDWLNIVGIVAFATSGAIVAMEEGYDLLGVLFLGFATAFGGGILRNVLIGESAAAVWSQGLLMGVALGAILIAFCLPRAILVRWRRLEVYFDAIGLAAFSIQAAIHTAERGFPLIAIMVAALLTGAGGGIIRDLLAHRKPMVFQRDNVYGAWALLAAAAIGLGWPRHGAPLALLMALVVGLRMASVFWRWSLPHRRSLT